MTKYASGEYVPKNIEKYIGARKITYRSSWELMFMRFCDNHPFVIKWASESIRIPYKNPLTGKQTIYVPDFLIVYLDKDGVTHCELIEIKPSSQTTMESAKSRNDKLMVALNLAKWKAASQFCQMQGMVFRVVNEQQLFAYTGTKR